MGPDVEEWAVKVMILYDYTFNMELSDVSFRQLLFRRVDEDVGIYRNLIGLQIIFPCPFPEDPLNDFMEITETTTTTIEHDSIGLIPDHSTYCRGEDIPNEEKWRWLENIPFSLSFHQPSKPVMDCKFDFRERLNVICEPNGNRGNPYLDLYGFEAWDCELNEEELDSMHPNLKPAYRCELRNLDQLNKMIILDPDHEYYVFIYLSTIQDSPDKVRLQSVDYHFNIYNTSYWQSDDYNISMELHFPCIEDNQNMFPQYGLLGNRNEPRKGHCESYDFNFSEKLLN